MPERLKARDLMSGPPVTIGEEATLAQAAQLMMDKRIGCLPVVDQAGDFVGLISDRTYFPEPGGLGYMSGDLSRVAGMWIGNLDALEDAMREAREQPVRDVMLTERVSVREEDSLSTVANTLVNDRIHHVVVLKGKKPVGVISRRDMLKVFAGRIEST
ncbi:MAG: CBS domain-containing protein [Chloroflexi bacterium]|nr:CBS domain-containing protein [Chloroflexota bacterium]